LAKADDRRTNYATVLVVLRPKKFRPFETRIVWVIALLLLGASIIGVVLAVRRADWRILIASIGVLGLALVYFAAARRGKPL
jgi:hypothetical protein